MMAGSSCRSAESAGEAPTVSPARAMTGPVLHTFFGGFERSDQAGGASGLVAVGQGLQLSVEVVDGQNPDRYRRPPDD